MKLNQRLKKIELKLEGYIRLAYHCFFYRPKPLDDIPPEHYLSIACCAKNEGRYIREWIEYHLWAGVEHFYIYDNASTDNTREVLKPYIQSGIVTYHYYVVKKRRFGSLQVRAYNDALGRYKYCTKWLALIDADEFITLTDEGKRQFGAHGGMINFFKQYEQWPAVGINWICFDGGGHKKMPESGYIIDNYTRVHKDQNMPRNRGFKSVVQPPQVKLCASPHFCLYKRFRKAVDENLRPGPMIRYRTKANSTRLIRINHYHSKSEEEYLIKMNVRKYPWNRARAYEKCDWDFPEWKTDDSMNEVAAYLRNKGVPETYSVHS